ncbi:hypothetical protein TL16_g02531 [Triparma laevis f. inornata]|uniref:Methyltransferase type 12 domain-containing protein n=2 Tax=Triparma laevis TaxID=1534972 RepID=A0A9W6ZZ47_9STRA|nr:hypothetical protein TL16_g02531 [Triparma laevis f. inornata]GMH63014.1 hypothetical protein TrLO_g10673 [Triparma laevis f. longispina]
MTMPLDASPPPSTSTRVLIAGGGTGDVVVYLAEMCSRFIEGNYKYRCGGSAGVEFYHLDLSNASIDIAKERLRMRGLLLGVEGVTVNFLQGSLLGLEFEEGRLALGLEKDIKFDYINSVGVLHHLASPTQGLRSLNSVLKPDGGMFIMLYGAHGRTGVYDVQSAIKDMGVDTVANPKICLDIVKSLISSLPPTHRLYKTVELMSQGDNLWPEESEIYDIFCHSQDRAYTVEQVFEFISEGGQGELTMASWHQPVLYRPSTYIKLAEETKLLTQLFMGVEDEVRLFALAEKLGGSVHGKHQFFLEKKKEGGGAIYKGRDWEVTGCGTREFQDTVLCSSMEEDIKDFTKDMWGEKFSEAYKADKGLNCVMQFEGATAGHGIEVKKCDEGFELN